MAGQSGGDVLKAKAGTILEESLADRNNRTGVKLFWRRTHPSQAMDWQRKCYLELKDER